jgi:heptosyltransferase I
MGTILTFDPAGHCPQSICLLRLSAIGDTCHVVPLLRALQTAWPEARITWIIGRAEARLMSLIPDVEFIIIDKRSRWRSARRLRGALAGRRFDLLLHLQTSLRASLLSLLVRARFKLGLDRARARELQWWFTDAGIAPGGNLHQQDLMLAFARALGIAAAPPRWDFPVPAAARSWAEQRIPTGTPTLLINPCSSFSSRNWRPERYAAVAAHAVQRHGLQVILCGGPSDMERSMAAAIERHCPVPLCNLVGQDTLPQLLALLERASALLSPDTGPVHMATMVDTPVIGLHAATRSARTGPWRSLEWCVDRYDMAARRLRGRPATALGWHEYIRDPGVMDLIEVGDVTTRLDALLAHQARCAHS